MKFLKKSAVCFLIATGSYFTSIIYIFCGCWFHEPIQGASQPEVNSIFWMTVEGRDITRCAQKD